MTTYKPNNHTRVRVRTSVKAGGLGSTNHGVRVRTSVKAGGLGTSNHGVRVRMCGEAESREDESKRCEAGVDH